MIRTVVRHSCIGALVVLASSASALAGDGSRIGFDPPVVDAGGSSLKTQEPHDGFMNVTPRRALPGAPVEVNTPAVSGSEGALGASRTRIEAQNSDAKASVSGSPIAGEEKSETPAAEGGDPFAFRGGKLAPVMRSVQQQGVNLISLGSEGGTKAYLGEASNGRYQAFYAAPDGDNVVVGLLFQSGGVNITNRQIERMLHRFTEAAKSAPGLDISKLVDPTPNDEIAKPSDLPIADWFRQKGFVVTPFGDHEGGLDAILVQTKKDEKTPNGLMQVFYVLPDPHYAVAGMLAKGNGTDVTGIQIAEMRQKQLEKKAVADGPKSSFVSGGLNPPAAPEVSAKLLEDIGKSDGPASENAKTTAEAPLVAVNAPAVLPTPPVSSSGKGGDKSIASTSMDENGVPSPVIARDGVPAPSLPVLDISMKPPSASDMYRSHLDAHQFGEALKTAVWFKVGVDEVNGTPLPVLYMVADPQCPFCHATWQKLKPLVFGRKLQVRVILIAGLKGSDPLTRSILARGNPSEAWLNGEGSVHGVPIKEGPMPGTPEFDRTSNYITINSKFISRFTIDRTPFLAYTKSDGTLYSTSGLPEDFDAFLAALKS